MEALDKAIYAALGIHQYKLARVIGEVNLATNIEPDKIAVRLSELVALGKLEGFGDFNKWRHSESRIKAQNPAI